MGQRISFTIGLRSALPDRAAVDAALRKAGRADDKAAAYRAAADMAASAAERRFHLTHAWVFALEAGHRVQELEDELHRLGAL